MGKISKLRSTCHWRGPHISKLTACCDCGHGKLHGASVIPYYIGPEQDVQDLVEHANPPNEFCSHQHPCELDRPRLRQQGRLKVDEWCIHTIAIQWDVTTNSPVGLVLPIRHHDLFKEWEISYSHTIRKFKDPDCMYDLKGPINCYIVDILQMVTEKLATPKLWQVDPRQQNNHQKHLYRNQHLYYFVSLSAGDGLTGDRRFGTNKWRGPTIQILGGKIDHKMNENAIKAAAREFREETHAVFQSAKFDERLDECPSIQIGHAQYCQNCAKQALKPNFRIKPRNDSIRYKCGCVAYRNLYIFPDSPVSHDDFAKM